MKPVYFTFEALQLTGDAKIVCRVQLLLVECVWLSTREIILWSDRYPPQSYETQL